MIDIIVGNRIILRKAKLTDLDSIYTNIWSDLIVASTMFFEPLLDKEKGIDRLNRTIEFQKDKLMFYVALKARSSLRSTRKRSITRCPAFPGRRP